MATTPNSPAASSRPSSTSVSRAVSPQPRRSSPAPLRLSPAAAAVSPVASRGVGGINKTTSPPPTPSPLSASHTFADLAAAIHPPFAHVVSPSHSVSSLSRAQQVTKGGASSTKPGLVRSQTEPASPRKLAKTQSSGLGGARDPEKLQRGGRSVRSVVSQVQHDPNEGATLVLEKYSLYETKTKFYIVASNQADLRYRVLKIDRTPPPERVKRRRDEKAAAGDDDDGFEGLNVVEDATIYSKDELQELLETLQAGNVGGITRTEANFYGFAGSTLIPSPAADDGKTAESRATGFVRFTSTYYMILIKSRVPVALIGGHYIYHCEDTMLKAITPGASSTRSAEEAKQKAAFMGVDLSKNFYFSYTYDVTHTLQHNLTTPIASAEAGDRTAFSAFNDKWMWNRHLLEPAFHRVRAKSPWVLPLIHGFVDQAKLSVYGRTVYITLIARRSRHFAGARFLKRGVNSEGYVANDVETEQIVSEALTTSFHYPTSDDGGERRRPNPRYTSFVQVRGSIPLFWSQESVNMSPKPPIELTVVDPFFAAAARHFDDLFGRYGGPITVLNLIKHHERQPRESKLLPEFKQCIDYLNQFLPAEQTIKYIAWDISADNKGNEKDVIGILDDIAEEAIESTNFFHTGPEPSWYALNTDPSFVPLFTSHGTQDALLTIRIERQAAGVPVHTAPTVWCHPNELYCRTNAAQFVIAKTALAHQLHALGIIHHPRLPFDSDAVDIMTEMFHDHGDTVALQYGGSHLVNTMATYRKIGAWTSHSRDMIENLRRYYTNSFIDGDKQAAIDLFLGIDSLASSIGISDRPLQRRSYRDWFTSTHLQRTIDPVRAAELLAETGSADGNYWQAYYRPKLFTEFSRHFAYKVNSTLKYNSTQTFAEDKDHSPFIPRRKEREKATSGNAPPSVRNNTGVAGGVRRWMSHRSATRSKLLPSQTQRSRTQSQKVDDAALAALNAASLAPPTTTEGLVARLLNPTLPADELAEYESYIDQFSHLSLSQDLSDKDAQLYKSSTGLAAGGGGGGGNGEGGGLSVDRASQALYVEACKIARPGQNLKGFAGAGAGQSSSHGDAEDRL